MNADGTVRRRSPGGSAARHLLDDLNAMRETGTSSEKLMQGAIDKPTPGPPALNRPATSGGTLNEATAPASLYNSFLAGTKMPYGTPVNPVKSYLWHDSDGKPIIVNVTEPGHGLEPGYVIHHIVQTPEGPRIQTEGEGLSPWQAPGSPQWLQKQLSEGTWAPISKESLTDPSRNRSDKALIGRLGRPRPVRARLRP